MTGVYFIIVSVIPINNSLEVIININVINNATSARIAIILVLFME